jgi:signal transduction histidine kinase
MSCAGGTWDHSGRMAVTHGVRPHVFDTWMALLAGDRVWHDQSDGPPSPRERASATAMVFALVLTVLVQWVALASRVDVLALSELTARERDLGLLTLGGVVAAGALAVRPLQLVIGSRRQAAGFWWSLYWRGLAYLTMIAVTAAVLPRLRFLGAVPLGLVAGHDALLTMWALGLTPSPTTWLKRLVFSGVHFGALGALIGTMVFDPDGPSTRTTLGVYAAMWTGVAVAAFTVLAANRLIALSDAQREDDLQQLRARERALRVHWLHDDVLSEVKLATLRIEGGGDVAAAKRELHELEHRLRVRQLEEMLRGGRARVYEIIQPHLRRAQSLGVRLDRVPALERTSLKVDEATGELLHRAVSNLMSNAIDAGATRLSLAIETADPSALEISVTDDAGGFSLDEIAPGGGLARLIRDLGPGAVRRDDVPGGSVVTIRIPLPPIAPPQTTPPIDRLIDRPTTRPPEATPT